uniref:Uncharacterized protein n=1 Tax=Timema shepardi TaxID=629360 RepID=A0A7R9FX11_TIMSH|nr:unnamed protein product [Timema shepardi]
MPSDQYKRLVVKQALLVAPLFLVGKETNLDHSRNQYGLLEGYTNGNGLLSTEDMTANQDVVNGTGERFVSKTKKLFDKVAKRKKMSHSQQHMKKNYIQHENSDALHLIDVAREIVYAIYQLLCCGLVSTSFFKQKMAS